jgi:glycopeptide antibiotics resistance protein
MPYIYLLLIQLAFLSFAMCGAYVGLLYLFPLFFENRRPKWSPHILRSLITIIVLNVAIDAIALSVPDLAVGNRVLHGLGGGAMAFAVCFFAARDSGVAVRRFQFFVFSALVVTALGVANEIFEFGLVLFAHFFIAADTWPDLVSNTVGILIAAGILTPLHKSEPSALRDAPLVY